MSETTVKNLIDRHKGQVGFVVGAGPSLRFLSETDIETMQKGVVIAVNSSLPKIPFADYFVADDIGVKNWDYYAELLPTLDTHALLYEDKLKGHADHLPEDRVTWFKHKWWYDPKGKNYNPDGLVMTKDEPIIGARTTSGSAIHFAHIMGCSAIVMLGMDCCYAHMRRYYWQFEGEKECKRITGEPVFSFPNRGKKDGEYVDSHCVAFVDYWDALSKQADKQGVLIYNASGGILDCFERVGLNDVDAWI